jgi:DNA-binding SARP family transcriptional activator
VSKTIELQLLGPPVCHHAGGSDVPGPRLAPLLALAALAAPLERGRAAELLYPQLEPAAARSNLRQLLHGQRVLVQRLLVTQGALLLLRPEVRVDVLHDPAADLLAAPQEPLLGHQRYDDLQEFQRWLDAQRERLQLRQRDRLADQASALEAGGRLAEALVIAGQLVLEQPASEHAHRRLMRLHYLRGDRAAALAAFDACEQLLKHELGARPGEETLVLLQQIEAAPLLPGGGGHRPVPPTVLRPPRLIGREHEWAALQAAWDSGAAAIVVGEAGMGKSRLIGDFALAQGEAAGQLLRVSARPGDVRVPFALFSRLLRRLLEHQPIAASAPGVRSELARLLPELGPPPAATTTRPDATEQARFLNALQAVLAAATGRGLLGLALDDLHFADDASIELAQHLATEGRLRWIVAFRGAELTQAGHALVEALTTSQYAVRLPLPPLTPEQIAALLASLAVPGLDAAALAAPLHQRTGGNLLYLLETLKALLTQGNATPGSSLPVTLRGLPPGAGVGALIERRIARLSVDAVRLARCAAVAGQDFSAELASAVLGVRPLDLADAWTELEAAEVLRDGGFAHDLIQEAAAASVPGPIARQLHGEIAQFLTQRQADVARIAAHWVAAGNLAQAVPALTEAARQARQRLRNADAVQALQTALDLLPADQHEARFSLAEQLLACQEDLGGHASTQPLLAQLRGLCFDDASTARWQLLQGQFALKSRQLEDGLAMLEDAVAAAERAGRADLAARARLYQAEALADSHRPDEAEARLGLARRWAETEASATDRAQWHHCVVRLLERAQRHDEGLALARAGHQAALASGDFTRVADLLNLQVMCLSGLGDYLTAVQTMDRLLAWDAEHAIVNAQYRDLNAAAICIQAGHYGAALQALQRAQTLVVADQGMLHARWAKLFEVLGQPARVAWHLDQLAALPDTSLMMQLSALLLRLRLQPAGAATIGDAARLDRLLDQAQLIAQRSGRIDAQAHVEMLLADRLAPALALPLLRNVAARLAPHCMYGYRLATEARLARCLAALGEPAAARRHVDAARALGQRYQPDGLYIAELGQIVVDVLQPLDPDAAATALGETVGWIYRTAAAHVPPAFRNSFLQRNPVNRALCLRADAQGQTLPADLPSS